MDKIAEIIIKFSNTTDGSKTFKKFLTKRKNRFTFYIVDRNLGKVIARGRAGIESFDAAIFKVFPLEPPFYSNKDTLFFVAVVLEKRAQAFMALDSINLIHFLTHFHLSGGYSGYPKEVIPLNGFLDTDLK